MSFSLKVNLADIQQNGNLGRVRASCVKDTLTMVE